MEVDYAGLSMTIINPETGETHQAPVFVATLPASNYIYAEVQPSQELCHWIGGHVRALSFMGGVPKIVRPDNPKTGVKSPNYYEPDLNPTYQEMAEYYQVAVLPARVRKPQDKAQWENGVQNVERWVLAPLRRPDLLQRSGSQPGHAAPLLEALNDRQMVTPGKSRRQFFEELDQPALRPLPEQPYEFATWKTARVNLDYHVAFEKHYYSVPHALMHQQVEIRATEHLVAIFHNGQQVAVHPRSRLPAAFRPTLSICLPIIALCSSSMRIGCCVRPRSGPSNHPLPERPDELPALSPAGLPFLPGRAQPGAQATHRLMETACQRCRKPICCLTAI